MATIWKKKGEEEEEEVEIRGEDWVWRLDCLPSSPLYLVNARWRHPSTAQCLRRVLLSSHNTTDARGDVRTRRIDRHHHHLLLLECLLFLSLSLIWWTVISSAAAANSLDGQLEPLERNTQEEWQQQKKQHHSNNDQFEAKCSRLSSAFECCKDASSSSRLVSKFQRASSLINGCMYKYIAYIRLGHR